MWQVTAQGSEGNTYVYEVDSPDYAPVDAVFESACRQHGIERQERGITETLDIRPGSYGIRLLYPQGQIERRDRLVAQAVEAGLTLEASDLQWIQGEPYVDGTPADDWLRTM